MINTTKAGQSLQLHEYIIMDSSSTTMQRKRSSEVEINADVYTDTVHAQDTLKHGSVEKSAASAPVTARGKNGSEQERSSGVPAAKRTSGSKQQIRAGVNGDHQSVIFVEPVLNGVAPTALGFKRLEDTVLNLQQRFEALDELANNPAMIERVRSNTTDPLTDMWHGININKRMDGCEEGIEKLTTMLQDLIKSEGTEINGIGSEDLDRLNERILELENQLVYLSGDVANLTNIVSQEDEEIPKTDSLRHAPSVMTVKKSKIPSIDDEPHKSSKVSSDDEEPIKSSKVASIDDETNKSSKVTSIVNEPKSAKVVSIGNELSAEIHDSPKSSIDSKGSDDKKISKILSAKRKTSTPRERRSVIGGIDLSELKNDVTALKTEIIELKQSVEDLNEKIVDIVESSRQTDDQAGSNLPGTTRVTSNVAGKSASTTDPDAASIEAGISSDGEKEITADATSLSNKNMASKFSLKPSNTRVIDEKHAASSSRVVPPQFESYEDVLRDLESRVTELEIEITGINEKLNSESLRSLSNDENGGIGDLVAKIQSIQADMEKMNVTASRLMDEKDNRESHTNAMIEQIELLKTIKADKEDLEDALADKADAHAVNRKVSHDQFDAACDDLARGLEDAIAKLSQQESIWQQSLDEVQREIEGKLDKIEISPLKEFVNKRLKLLQEKLKALADMRRENEAAGTKKMLSDVQCISCDSNVVMKMEEGVNYRAPTLPCTKSIKPYLTYELDQVRKQQRRLPNSRNMIQFEAAMQEMARKTKPLKDELTTKSPSDHLCNRYCGGSHTTTTPQQRVMRMGHFLTQWGPEAVQLTEGVVRGNDGQLYRSRPMPVKPEASGAAGDGDSIAEISPTTPQSPVIPESFVASQRHSQSTRGRSSTSQTPAKRTSNRRSSEANQETRNDEIPMITSMPPGAPPGTFIDDDVQVSEPSGPNNEIVHRASLENNHEDEEEMPEQHED